MVDGWRVAGLGVGLFGPVRQAAALDTPVIERCRPDKARHALYSDLFAVYKEAQARLAPFEHGIGALFA